MSKPVGIVWEDPPPQNRKGGRPRIWEARLVPLIDHPKRWARVAEYLTPASAHSACGSLKKAARQPDSERGGVNNTYIPPGKWDFAARSVDGKSYVYARYMGESD